MKVHQVSDPLNIEIFSSYYHKLKCLFRRLYVLKKHITIKLKENDARLQQRIFSNN